MSVVCLFFVSTKNSDALILLIINNNNSDVTIHQKVEFSLRENIFLLDCSAQYRLISTPLRITSSAPMKNKSNSSQNKSKQL